MDIRNLDYLEEIREEDEIGIQGGLALPKEEAFADATASADAFGEKVANTSTLAVTSAYNAIGDKYHSASSLAASTSYAK